MYLALLEQNGGALESAVVESKHGDVLYASLEFRDRQGIKYRTITSFADALILSTLARVDLYILNKVIDELEDFQEITYFNEMGDDMSEPEDF